MVIIKVSDWSKGRPSIKILAHSYICTLIHCFLDYFDVWILAYCIVKSPCWRFESRIHFLWISFRVLSYSWSWSKLSLRFSLGLQIRLWRYSFILPWSWIVLPIKIKHSKLKSVFNIRTKCCLFIPSKDVQVLFIHHSFLHWWVNRIIRINVRSRSWNRVFIFSKQFPVCWAEESMMLLFLSILEDVSLLFSIDLSIVWLVILRTRIEFVCRFGKRSV